MAKSPLKKIFKIAFKAMLCFWSKNYLKYLLKIDKQRLMGIGYSVSFVNNLIHSVDINYYVSTYLCVLCRASKYKFSFGRERNASSQTARYSFITALFKWYPLMIHLVIK